MIDFKMLSLNKRICSFSVSVFLIFALSGCSSAVLKDVNRPWLSIRAIIVRNLPNGLRSTSPNGRELISNYFPTSSGDFKLKPIGDEPRAFAKVSVFGAGRPYTIEVRIYKEKKSDDEKSARFERDSDDKELAKKLLDLIEADLEKSPDSENPLKKFRPF